MPIARLNGPLRLALGVALLGLAWAPFSAAAGAIVVLKSKSIPQYDQALAGLRAAFGGELHTFDLDGRLDIAPEVAARVRALAPSAVVAIGARAAQVARAARLSAPLVHCLVLHPERLGLRGARVHGVPLRSPARVQLQVLRRLAPRARRIGLLGDPRKHGAAVLDMRRAARRLGYALAMTRITRSQEVPAALEQLLPRVDVVVLLPDAGVLSDESFRYLLLQSFRRGLPVVAFARSFVRAGALFALSPDYRAMGRAAAGLLRSALAGKAPRTTVAPPSQLIINVTTAHRLGLRLSPDLRSRAELVD